MKKALITLFSLSAAFANDPCWTPIANGPLYPVTCDGDFKIEATGYYWTAYQDGISFAVENQIHVPALSPTPGEIEELNNLVDDDIYGPKRCWDFGFRVGAAYTSACDGWDIGVEWTYFHPQSHVEFQADIEDNASLITLLSAFAPVQGEVNYAREIKADWKGKLHVGDFSLGRAYWVSKRIHLRPAIGVRYAQLDQQLSLEHRGGSWSPRMNPVQQALNNYVILKNAFHGVGPIFGLGGAFHLGCGFEVYASGSGSLVYGRFKTSHKEENRLTNSPYTKDEICHSSDYFRASRAIFDATIGIGYRAQYCEGCLGLEAKLGWEHHLLLHQNQLFRVVRIGDSASSGGPNESGQNFFGQQRGNFTTQGWTLSFAFLF